MARLLSRLALAACLVPAASQAARPFVTDDAGVIEARHCEWETVGARTRFDADPTQSGGSTQLNCGVGYSTQFGLGYVESRGGGEKEQAVSAAGKSEWVETAGVALSISYGANLLQISDASLAVDSLAANLIATAPLAQGFTGHANLGWLRTRRDHSQSTTWGTAIEYAVAEHVDAGIEAYGDDRSSPLAGLGWRWTPNGAFSANVAYGVQFAGSRVRSLSAGVKISF